MNDPKTMPEAKLPKAAQAQRFYCNKCGNGGEGPGYPHQRRDGSECSYMAPTHGPYYTADQLREYGRQCAQAAVPVMPEEVMDGVRLLEALAKFPSRKDEGPPLRALLAWLRSQNLIKDTP